MEQENLDKKCVTCYQIVCKKCSWIATEEEVALIQKKILTKCPLCGWSPSIDLQKS